jgi:hypothetical protein
MYFLQSVYVSTYHDDSWSDLKDDARNTLHIGKLEYKTKYGKKADSFLSHVHPRDVKSALYLVVNPFLEQTKVADEESNIHDSLMKLIKTSAINKALHADSFGKVSVFLLRIIWIHVLYKFIYHMNLFII